MIIPADVVLPLSLWQLAAVVTAVYFARNFVLARRKAARETPLGCPPRQSWLFGIRNLIAGNPDAGSIYEAWIDEYGSVYRVPAPLGSTRVVITDPKAIAHFYSVETWTYVQTKLARVAIEGLVRCTTSCSRFIKGEALTFVDRARWCCSWAVDCFGPKESPTRGSSL